MVEPRAAIVIPTLHLDRAAKVAAEAQTTAGVPACAVIVADSVRRGGILPANAGFRAALEMGTPYVVYLNDDTSFPRTRWLARLIDALEEDPTYGVACPSGHFIRGSNCPQQNTGPGAEPGVFVMPDPMAWHCAVLRREVLAGLGLFDPVFWHFGGDSDLTRRMQAAGWKSIWVRDAYVHHEQGPLDVEWKRRDKGIYLKRWGR